MYVKALFIDAYTFLIVMSFYVLIFIIRFLFLVIFLVLKTILADNNIATPTALWSLFAKYIFSHPFTFNLSVFFNLNCR